MKNFILIQLFALGCFVFCSFRGIAALKETAFFVALSFILLGVKKIKDRKGSLFTFPHLAVLILFLIYASMVYQWFAGIWVMPSNDDTINHLGFLQSILQSKHSLLGQIDRPGWESFGQSRYHFYPTGSHALVAIWITFVQWILPKLSWVLIFKGIIMATLCFWPIALWFGSVRAFPNIPVLIRFFLVACALTLPAFPLDALGEGGSSRIIAMILMTPLWFEAMRGPKSFKFGFFWSGMIAPMMLFIHPSALPFLALAVLFFRKRAFLGTLFGAILGGWVFWLLIKSGQQEVTQPSFVTDLLASMGIESNAWFDRMKGPFHYWFTDPNGFGKFLSPKNYFIYAAFVLSLVGRLPRKVLLLFLTPFIFAALALIPHPLAQQLGLVFYHAVKRIAEIIPLLGFTLALFAAQYLAQAKPRVLESRFLAAPLAMLGILFLFLFQKYALPGLDKYHALFATTRIEWVSEMSAKLNAIPSTAQFYIDRHDFDAIRFFDDRLAYTLKPECAEVGSPSSYCTLRAGFAEKVLNGQISEKRESWWIPPAAIDQKALEIANQKGLKNVELSHGIHLIQLPISATVEK